MSKIKAGGTTKLGRDSISKRLGVKVFGEQPVNKGQIIIRQRGQKYKAGDNVLVGGDDTIYAAKDGIVKFQKKKCQKFTGQLHTKTFVSVA